VSDEKRPPPGPDGLKSRAVRSSVMTAVSFAGENVLRLASNLILTRILFPEVFGIMALIQVVMSGLEMFSDVGIKTSILQSRRGDDPDFLNTAWTLQILRGVVLWLAACALAVPAARLYDAPELMLMLPVVGLRPIIAGFTTTNIMSANRHLRRMGRQIWGELGCQALGIALTIVFALILRSAWAMVIAGLIATVFRVWLFHTILPGIRNRWRWDRTALGDLIGFGKWIFLATAMGFFINQGDRAILGAHISLAQLGVYNIGLFMGSMPFLLSKAAASRVILPLYRMRPPAESAANRRKMFRARRMLVAATLAISSLLAFIGVPLIELLYDPRYALAGPMVVLFSLSLVPQIVFDGYTGALLSRGDSRNFFLLLAVTAALQLTIMLVAVPVHGIGAAIVAPGIAAMVAYPLRIRFVRRHQSWDPLGDLGFLALGLAVNGAACWLVRDQIALLFG
jgi:O-antigen/teichoic acid export membrane protein